MWSYRRISLLSIFAAGLLAGCAETPKQPVMRPIPPPPPTPPPGVAYIPQQVTTNPNPAVIGSSVLTSTNVQGLEVSSNYVSSAQQPTITALPGATPGTVVSPSPQSPPQYEVVPPRPGPDYVWRNGYWRWENAWMWIPGEWIYQPPPVIIVPGGGFYYHHYYGGGPWRYGPRHRW